MIRRLLLRTVVVLPLLASGCTGGDGTPDGTGTTPSPDPIPTVLPGSFARAACSLPPEQLLRVWRGSPSDRVGDILLVPEEPNFVDGGLSHAGPWDYLQRVPFLLYGPGQVEPVGSIDRPVTMADVAPTFAELVGFGGFATPDGTVLSEALPPRAERGEPPALVITVVWDAGGRVVLDAHPDAWPVLRGLIEQGAWYENATVGSSPSVTAPIHATLGTGRFPRAHGHTDSQVRIDGVVLNPWREGPASMRVATLGDLYDLAMDNEPIVGAVATLTWHLGMLSHGSQWQGGDQDIAILRQKPSDDGTEADEWNLPGSVRPWYSFPAYANDLSPLEDYLDEVDAMDGEVDGTWRGHAFDEEKLRGGFHTPARIPYETRLIEEVIVREGFGDDEIPDLLYTNYKVIDEVGHSWTMNGPEMGDTVREQDRDLGELIGFLDEEVGEGRWVLLVTADHGHTPDPRISGAFRISVKSMEQDLGAAFDRDGDAVPVVVKVRPTQVYLDTEELADNGFTVDQVAQYLLEYTKGDAARPNASIPPGEEGDRVFSAVLPTSVLDGLPCLPPEARA